jgi:hypothetical protein
MSVLSTRCQGVYQGELNFFDFYIIPLAKKLEECRTFGVLSNEYLCYALKNRVEWEVRGLYIVAEMTLAAEAATGSCHGRARAACIKDQPQNTCRVGIVWRLRLLLNW